MFAEIFTKIRILDGLLSDLFLQFVIFIKQKHRKVFKYSSVLVKEWQYNQKLFLKSSIALIVFGICFPNILLPEFVTVQLSSILIPPKSL